MIDVLVNDTRKGRSSYHRLDAECRYVKMMKKGARKYPLYHPAIIALDPCKECYGKVNKNHSPDRSQYNKLTEYQKSENFKRIIKQKFDPFSE